MTNVNEQDEFLLSQLLDGTLSEEDTRALRERIDREPALRAAFEGMSRVNTLVRDRRADQPDVDYDTFRSRVMDAVYAERQGTVIFKLARWLAGGGAIAIAAVIALIVVKMPNPDSLNDTVVSDDQAIVVALNQPSPMATASGVSVSVGPAASASSPSNGIKVSVVRSESLAMFTQELDAKRQGRHSVIVASLPQAVPARYAEVDLPPL